MSRKVNGVIFQFNLESVLFEFENETEEESIGSVDLHNVVINAKGEVIPNSITFPEEITAYINIGDEIECEVVKDENLKKFVYVEDEEEINEAGEIQNSSHEVEIQPLWRADKAKLLKIEVKKPAASKENQQDDTKEITVVKENITKKIQDNQQDDTKEITVVKENITKKIQDDVFKKPEVPQRYKVINKSTKTISTNAASSEKSGKVKSESPEAKLVKARIVQLKRPTSSDPKVVTAYFQITEGKNKGKKLWFGNHNFYVWGHHMNRADFLYYIKYGDKVLVEIHPPSERKDNLSVKKVYLGKPTTKYVDPSEDKDFANWIASRAIDYNGFKRWMGGMLKKKPFFPLNSTKVKCILTQIFRNKMANKTIGVLKVIEEGGMIDKLVLFDSDVLYLFEVSIGSADMRLFLQVGEVLHCQVQDMLGNEKKKFKKLINDDLVDVNMCLVADLVYKGHTRPRSALIQPYKSPELLMFLKSNGYELDDFLEMRTKKEPKPMTVPGPSVSKNSGVESVSHTDQTINTSHRVSATQLTAKAMMLSSLEDPLIHNLIMTDEDIQNATNLARIFTQALLIKLHSSCRKNVAMQFGASTSVPQARDSLINQHAQINMAVNSLLPPLGQKVELEPSSHIMPQLPSSYSMTDQTELEKKADNAKAKAIIISQQLEEVDARRKEEERIRQERALIKKKEEGSKKIKKLLQSFKAAKGPIPMAKVQEQRLRREKEVQLQKSLSSLELLRHYLLKRKKVTEKRDVLVFGKREIDKTALTNFRITKGIGLRPEFYTIHAVYFFSEHMNMFDQKSYMKQACNRGIPTIRIQDRNLLTDYLKGNKDNVTNLVTPSEKGSDDLAESFKRKSENYESESDYQYTSPSTKKRSRFDQVAHPDVGSDHGIRYDGDLNLKPLNERDINYLAEKQNILLNEEKEKQIKIQQQMILEQQKQQHQLIMQGDEQRQQFLQGQEGPARHHQLHDEEVFRQHEKMQQEFQIQSKHLEEEEQRKLERQRQQELNRQRDLQLQQELKRKEEMRRQVELVRSREYTDHSDNDLRGKKDNPLLSRSGTSNWSTNFSDNQEVQSKSSSRWDQDSLRNSRDGPYSMEQSWVGDGNPKVKWREHAESYGTCSEVVDVQPRRNPGVEHEVEVTNVENEKGRDFYEYDPMVPTEESPDSSSKHWGIKSINQAEGNVHWERGDEDYDVAPPQSHYRHQKDEGGEASSRRSYWNERETSQESNSNEFLNSGFSFRSRFNRSNQFDRDPLRSSECDNREGSNNSNELGRSNEYGNRELSNELGNSGGTSKPNWSFDQEIGSGSTVKGFTSFFSS